eukprot:GHVU01128533.1.p1 GENE.GHVU01128533.1~~GHVU01128533.1.p1  ORF type:complete len:612 (-),score=113.78 GHVU01128533.1:326-2077(-)
MLDEIKAAKTDEIQVLKAMSVSNLQHVIASMSGGASLSEAIDAAGGELKEALRRAAEEQYQTVDASSLAAATADDGDDDFGDALSAGMGPPGAGTFIGPLPSLATDVASKLDWLNHHAHFTPLRLSYEERKYLRLVDAALDVSEYTDKVDVYHTGGQAHVMAREIKGVCAILSGLVVAHNYQDGKRLIANKDFKDNERFFQEVFEISRRYKMLNPDRMRDSYGKLLYLLMDSCNPRVQEMLEFQCVTQVHTVGNLAQARENGAALLQDPLLVLATQEIFSEGKQRHQVQSDIQRKEKALRALKQKHGRRQTGQKKARGILALGYTISSYFTSDSSSANGDGATNGSGDPHAKPYLSEEEVEQCVYSLSDHNSHLRFNKRPCTEMIRYLKEYFRPDAAEPNFSLSIQAGREGARLTHHHERQYKYVLESLLLWEEIQGNMMKLWAHAEADLMDSPYQLRGTGQGLNRVQDAPRIHKLMNQALKKVMNVTGGWVGSTVVHIGDHNVPNAFMFIDKYTQVPRILNPVVLCLSQISRLYASNSATRAYIDSQYRGEVSLKKNDFGGFFPPRVRWLRSGQLLRRRLLH